MNALTEGAWKAVIGKTKVKDNGLQRALADFERVDEEDHDAQLKALGKVEQLAGGLKRNRDVAANEDAMDYLNDLLKEVQAEEREILKSRASADKAEALADKQEKKEEAYESKLWAMLQKVKSGGGTSFEFLFCEGPEKSALIIAPSVGGQQKQQLVELTQGRRFYGPGTVRFTEGIYQFAADRVPSAFSKKLQATILDATKRRIALEVVGVAEAEEAEAEEEPGAGA